MFRNYNRLCLVKKFKIFSFYPNAIAFKGDHEPDLIYIETATKAAATVLQKGNLVVLESTSPVGTTDKMASSRSLPPSLPSAF